MLDQDPAYLDMLLVALRAWHRNQGPAPATVTTDATNTNWEIPYGYNGDQVGTIRMTRNNFEVTHVTDAGGAFVEIAYNHVWPGNCDSRRLAEALSCATLANNQGARSLIILITSEAARSLLVQRFVKSVLGGTANAAAYTAVRALTAQYGHTQLHVGGQVGPGPGWSPLEIQDHLHYALHQRDKLHVVSQFDGVHSINEFCNNALLQ